MVLLITYDLNKPDKDYSALYTAIKGLSGVWWHKLTSVWLVETSIGPQQAAQKLRSVIDKNDELLIIRVHRDYDGYLPQDAWTWLNNRTY